MKALFLVFVAWVAVGITGARGDLTLVQKVEGLGESMETTTRYKDGQIRLDVTPGGTSTVLNARTGETLQLQHAQKKFLKIPGTVMQAALDGIKKQQQQKAEADGKPTAPVLKPTGRKETISGFAAEEYEAATADGRLVFWLTHGIPDYERAMAELAAIYTQGPLAAMSQTASVDMAHLPGFPVRIVNETGKSAALTSTVTSVSVGPIDDEVFKVPAGYEEIRMPVLTPPAAASVPEPAH